VVLNKDGSFQRTLRFRGPDLESATEADLVSACARANNVLKRFGTGWALFIEAERREALGYGPSDENRGSVDIAPTTHLRAACRKTVIRLPAHFPSFKFNDSRTAQ